MHDLGQAGLHPGAEAGGQDDDRRFCFGHHRTRLEKDLEEAARPTATLPKADSSAKSPMMIEEF
jgi:hypothetical protein